MEESPMNGDKNYRGKRTYLIRFHKDPPGIYTAESETDALNVMAREAGYDSFDQFANAQNVSKVDYTVEVQ
jgi:hypothetical protein